MNSNKIDVCDRVVPMKNRSPRKKRAIEPRRFAIKQERPRSHVTAKVNTKMNCIENKIARRE